MTQEDKDLLLEDLCARLPYGVICTDKRHGASKVTEVDIVSEVIYLFDVDEYVEIKNCKPYLRPMSSMTEKETKEFFSIWTGSIRGDMIAKIDFYIKHYFDFRLTSEGLSMIEAGLALEAPEGMYNIKEK